jgi:hypothetical protein
MQMKDWTDMLATTRAAIVEYEVVAAELENMELTERYIVQIEGLPLGFDIVDGCAVDPRPVKPQLATRFTCANAGRVAARVRNGNGKVADIMCVRQAVHLATVNQRDLLAVLLSAESDIPLS